LFAPAGALAASGTVALAGNYYAVVLVEPAFLGNYTGARMYSFLPDGLRAGDKISGIENTWGAQVWHAERAGQEIKAGVEKFGMTSEEAIQHFSENSK